MVSSINNTYTHAMGKWEDECFLRFKRESDMHVYQKNDNVDTTVTFTFSR